MKNPTLKTKLLIINAFLAILTLTLNYFYITRGGLLFKTLTSFSFVIMGLVNVLFATKSKDAELDFPMLMLCGLIFSMVGDVALNLHFTVGAIIFALGHILYFLAYSRLLRIQKSDLIPMGAMLAFSLCIVLLVPLFDFDSPLIKGVIILYALVISCMLGKAISNLVRERSLTSIILAVGSTLFYISDFVLFLDVFGDIDVGNACLATYYPAQVLLAFSIFAVQLPRRKN